MENGTISEVRITKELLKLKQSMEGKICSLQEPIKTIPKASIFTLVKDESFKTILYI